MTLHNILITSAGRRVGLVRNFQQALKKYNPDGNIYTVDLFPELSSGCQVSDGWFKAPRVTDKDYLDFLKDLCIEKKISIVVPTIDTELSLLASIKEEMRSRGVLLAVSSEELCKKFHSKRSTEALFRQFGVSTPKIYQETEIRYPAFAKLDHSSSSIGAQIVQDEEKVKSLMREGDYVIQELIQGEEYTVDVFIASNGDAISVVPRKRLETRAGEVSKACTVKHRKVIDEILRICSRMEGAYGPLTIQLFENSKGLYFIEVNPRFGGGYPLTWSAGSDFASYLIEDYLGRRLVYDESWEDGLLMLRYDAEVLVHGHCL